MTFDVVLYDEYFNIPLRGLLKDGSSLFAFKARIPEDDPPEIAGRRGVPAQVDAFRCDERLKLVLEEKKAIFVKWRGEFDAGRVDKLSHPLYADPHYKELSDTTRELFRRLGPPVLEMIGLMKVVDGLFRFEPLQSCPGPASVL